MILRHDSAFKLLRVVVRITFGAFRLAGFFSKLVIRLSRSATNARSSASNVFITLTGACFTLLVFFIIDWLPGDRIFTG